jgi:hypothetical protein
MRERPLLRGTGFITLKWASFLGRRARPSALPERGPEMSQKKPVFTLKKAKKARKPFETPKNGNMPRQ